MNEELNDFLRQLREEYREKTFFIEQNLGAEVHWFFAQAVQALKSELYLPACTSFLIGIEASLRVTMHQIHSRSRVKSLDPRRILSNRLLKDALSSGLPIETLSFPEETDFLDKLEKKSVNVEIVRVRHNLCHGNIFEYINDDLGEENAFFTPECCRELALSLYQISESWAAQLGSFRRTLS